MILDQDYQTASNDQFQSLKGEIMQPLQDRFCDGFPVCEVSITGFRVGSVIADFLVSIASGGLSRCEISQQLSSQLSSLPSTIGGVPVTPGSLIGGKSKL